MNHSTLSQIAQQEKARREILHRSDLIPPLPDLVVRLLGLLGREETTPLDLERLLQNDQVLVAKLLAMVNSPFYGLNRTIRSIREAVMVLGFRGVRSLVLAASTSRFLQRDYSCYGHQPQGLWAHAVAVGAGARELARRSGIDDEDAEMLFIAGLLHDIGKMLLVSFLNDASGKRAPGSSIVEFERAVVGFDHAEVGAMVTARWSLCEEVNEVIRSHHHAPCDATTRSTAIVRVADALAHEMGVGYQPGKAPTEPLHAADLAKLGVTAQAWPALRDTVAVTVNEAVAAMSFIGS